MIRKCVQSLAGFQPVYYSWCINSCICFVGPYKDLIEEGKKIEDMELRTGVPLMPYILARSSHVVLLGAISTSCASCISFL